MNMSRDDFLAALIGELEKQKSDNVELFEKPQKLSANEVYRKMCYDSPLVESTDIETLTDHLAALFDQNQSQKVTQKKVIVSDRNDFQFSFHQKFVDNVIYMAGIIPASNDEQKSLSKPSSALCLILFIKGFRYFLQLQRQDISRLFEDKPLNLEDISASHASSIASDSLTWSELVDRSCSILRRCTSSLLVSAAIDQLSKYRILQDLTEIIGLLNPYRRPSTNLAAASSSTLVGLYSASLQSSNSSGSPSDSHSDPISTAITNDSSKCSRTSVAIETESDMIYHALRDIWVHYIFICRDLFVQFPSLIEEHFPPFVDKLLTGIYRPIHSSGRSAAASASISEYELDESTFPVANECLLVIVVTTIASHLLSNIEICSSNRSTTAKRTLQRFRMYIDLHLPILSKVTERMITFGTTSDEGISLAVELCYIYFTNRLYCSDSDARSIDKAMDAVVEQLANCRLWPLILQRYIAHATATATATSAQVITTETSDQRVGDRNLLTGTVITRIWELLALASAESEMAFQFVNIPAIQKGLLADVDEALLSENSNKRRAISSGLALYLSICLSSRLSDSAPKPVANTVIKAKKPAAAQQAVALLTAATAATTSSNWAKDITKRCLEAIKVELARALVETQEYVSRLGKVSRPAKEEQHITSAGNNSTSVDVEDSDHDDPSVPPAELVDNPITNNNGTGSSSNPASSDPMEDHRGLPQVPSDLLKSIAALLAVDRLSIARIPLAINIIDRLLQRHQDLRAVLSQWAIDITGICVSITDSINSSSGGIAVVDKSWHDLRKLMKVLKATCEVTSSKVE